MGLDWKGISRRDPALHVIYQIPPLIRTWLVHPANDDGAALQFRKPSSAQTTPGDPVDVYFRLPLPVRNSSRLIFARFQILVTLPILSFTVYVLQDAVTTALLNLLPRSPCPRRYQIHKPSIGRVCTGWSIEYSMGRFGLRDAFIVSGQLPIVPHGWWKRRFYSCQPPFQISQDEDGRYADMTFDS